MQSFCADKNILIIFEKIKSQKFSFNTSEKHKLSLQLTN
jgi:hypothetical protein